MANVEELLSGKLAQFLLEYVYLHRKKYDEVVPIYGVERKV